MTAADLIYDEIFKKCINNGCTEQVSRDAATGGLQKYKNNQFTTVSKMINQQIVDAKKLIIKKRKNFN